MKSIKDDKILNAFNELFDNLSEQDKLENEAKLIMFRFLDIIERKRVKKKWSRKELAKKVGTSASYITQLMRGDKLINMLTLAKMQNVLDFKFDVSEIVSYHEQTEDKIPPITDGNGVWVYKKFKSPNYDEKGYIPKLKQTEEVEVAA
ncbi:MAG TPA: XRE family transcriptional regulator [Mariniphaga anaerophila]|uniref:XRE family transcriptional regulator n=1 Tax=Mariniphaga anaerophila TaxID=1484053 RepID=A0A831LI85_9BACT|nr:XRE family transcriptional regulator [Mariniphaga anaerophila]